MTATPTPSTDRPQRPRLIAAAAALGIVVLLALIVASSFEMPIGAGLVATVDTLWGVTTMVDLYLGLFVVAGWIGWRERSVGRTLAWLVGLCLLGNLVTLAYLLRAAMRANSLRDLFEPVR